MKPLIDRAAEINICATCGTRYATARTNDDPCSICSDDRQYLGDNGQEWTSFAKLASGRTIRFAQLQPQLYDLRVTPGFGINQKVHLVLSPGGNVLWDCLPFLDEEAITFIQSKGGLKAIAISHPHYYSLMTEWARIFDCPIYLHRNDEQWVMDSKDRIEFWEGKEKILWDDLRLIHTAGHFPGSIVMLCPHHGTSGTLLTGDSIYVSRDRKQLSFMYSYPNAIPLPKKDILYIHQQVEPLPFDALHGAFEWMNIERGAKETFQKSIKRYLQIFE